MNTWHVSFDYYDGSYRGRLIDDVYGGVIDVSHLYDDWTARDYNLRAQADGEAVWKYGTYTQVKEAAIRQWRKIGYLTWWGSTLMINGEAVATVEARS
jgi:hypothetical protein